MSSINSRATTLLILLQRSTFLAERSSELLLVESGILRFAAGTAAERPSWPGRGSLGQRTPLIDLMAARAVFLASLLLGAVRLIRRTRMMATRAAPHEESHEERKEAAAKHEQDDQCRSDGTGDAEPRREIY